jgi:putative Mn2+ efflux pump MntP
MAKPRSKVARAALISGGMVWFGLSLMLAGIAGEQTYAAFIGSWSNLLGWVLLMTVAISLAVVGIIENRKIRAGKFRPRSYR